MILLYDQISQQVLDNSANFGITNITALYTAGVDAAKQIQKVCVPVVAVAVMLKIFSFITKIYTEREADFFALGKTFLIILFLFQYEEIMTQLNTLISYFTDNIQALFGTYGSGNTLVDKIDKVYEAYKQANPDPGIMDGYTPLFDWIIANCTHMIIIIARALTYIVRSLIMVFLFATGPIAILVSLFPGFEGTLGSWLKYYISVGFWIVSIAILDLLLYHYLDYCQTSHTIEGLTTVNVGMALMYLMAPYLTSRYIGGQGSQMMSRMIQSATTLIAVSGRNLKSISPLVNYAGDRGYRGSAATLSKTGNIIAGGKEGDTIPKAAGGLYNTVKNNFINRNKPEN